MGELIINHELCNMCERCVSACPFQALEISSDLLQVTDECVLCGACVEECPEGALKITSRVEGREGWDTESWNGVMVFVEQIFHTDQKNTIHPVVFELIGKGAELADVRGVELTAVVMGDKLKGAIETLKGYPLDRICCLRDKSLRNFRSDSWSAALAELIEERKPEIFLCGATSLGRALFPRIAAHLHAGLTADCTGLRIDPEEGLLEQTRPAFGGNIMAEIVCPEHRPQMATVRPNVLESRESSEKREVETIDFSPSQEALSSSLEVLDEYFEVGQDEDLSEADVVIAGGMGVGSEKGFDLIREVAESVDAAVGASRAAVDAGWIEYHHQVGQTGRTVQPRLYIACGISGAVQHLVGMQSADKVIAINTDPGAPIFESSDLGLVGDLHRILPRLKERLR